MEDCFKIEILYLILGSHTKSREGVKKNIAELTMIAITQSFQGLAFKANAQESNAKTNVKLTKFAKMVIVK